MYHDYVFFSIDKSQREIPKEKLEMYKKEFIKEISHFQDVITYSYSLLGLKQQIVCMLWLQSDSIEQIQELLSRLTRTMLGQHLTISYTLFGMVRPTHYALGSVNHLETRRKGGKYLIIYPFTKTQEWHMLSFNRRKTLMKGHIAIGKKYPQISQLLVYSYGVDDNEFIVSYETDDLADFQQLVMELRSDKVRVYTKIDTPIFTCIYYPLERIVDFL
jgi:chlorite dismutase